MPSRLVRAPSETRLSCCWPRSSPCLPLPRARCHVDRVRDDDGPSFRRSKPIADRPRARSRPQARADANGSSRLHARMASAWSERPDGTLTGTAIAQMTDTTVAESPGMVLDRLVEVTLRHLQLDLADASAADEHVLVVGDRRSLQSLSPLRSHLHGRQRGRSVPLGDRPERRRLPRRVGNSAGGAVVRR
jgi:hypothetical protein